MTTSEAGTLDRTSALPLWAQLEADLRRRLAAGGFDAGFPTESELIDDYGVSRPTVRQAVAALADAGLVVRTRGRGTEVTGPVEHALGGSYSMARAISATGQAEHSRVLTAEVAPLPRRLADRIGIAAGDDAVHVVRQRFADDEPLAVDRSWLPLSVGQPLLSADLSSGSLYDVLAADAGVRPTRGEEEIRPVRPNAKDRRLLGLGADGLAFEVERLLWAGPAPFEHRTSVIRADRYRLTNRWGGPA